MLALTSDRTPTFYFWRGIPKHHYLGFCFFLFKEELFAPGLTDLLCSALTVAPQTDTASPAAKMFILALISRSW
ncbi:hypothetical protein WN50_04340 [Limnoraphis robusta CS-951]|uniref:Uncharacterized protein n=1 Tax=Limnoraphis robusta CS-951 TaxID=1637645 RepID=A0A0F5YKH4_9CYAN|nr:hypothetical protein WN50_04340 [Limnoraphis robusta CS-951]